MDIMAAFPREHRMKGVLFDNPSYMVAIIVAYIAIVTKLGPDYMKNRKPLNLRNVTRVQNVIQIILNVWFCYHALDLAWRYRNSGRFDLPCTPATTEQPDLEGPGDTEHLIHFSKVYFYVRILDFLDTIFFVLAKKFTHVSFLHVYHHVAVVATAYVYLRSGWGNTIYYVSIVNAMVHIVMYTYYLLSTFPSMRPYLWWKRYLTALQITQFVVMGAHMAWFLVDSCGLPSIVVYYNVGQAIMFITLFSRFYIQSYKTSPDAAAKNGSSRTTVTNGQSEIGNGHSCRVKDE